MKYKIKFKRLTETAKLPTQNKDDVGFDIYADENTGWMVRNANNAYFPPVKIRTGIALAERSPKTNGINTFFKIEGRSGLASEGLFPTGGIIDASYRGELMVIMNNISGQNKFIKKGDKIAQLVLYGCLNNSGDISVELVETDEIEKTERGDKGFGSSGR